MFESFFVTLSSIVLSRPLGFEMVVVVFESVCLYFQSNKVAVVVWLSREDGGR
jgi:hypothetical protein